MEAFQLRQAFQTSPLECLDSLHPFPPHYLMLEQLQDAVLGQGKDYESKLYQKASGEH